MKQLTAMQQAINHYEILSLKGSNEAYVVAKYLKKHFLEIEKEQIIDAHNANGAVHGENYYNQTYNHEV